jgi:hypothetical protein
LWLTLNEDAPSNRRSIAITSGECKKFTRRAKAEVNLAKRYTLAAARNLWCSMRELIKSGAPRGGQPFAGILDRVAAKFLTAMLLAWLAIR